MLLAAGAVALLSAFALARFLTPDRRGYGTHEQLGLPPCSFRVLTGLPCPSCGMTTSFAYFVRGRFAESARANTAGSLLAGLAVMGIPWCMASAVAGRTLGVRSFERLAMWILLGSVAVSLANWFVTVLFGEQR